MCPSRRARMPGSTPWERYIAASRLISICSRQAAGSAVSTLPGRTMPAALTRMSMRPWRARTSATTLRASGSRAMSAGKAAARCPAAWMRFTRSSNRSARRATTATRAPSRASSSAVAAPIPEEAPVTRATRSFTSRSPWKSKASPSTDQPVRLFEDAAQCIQPFRPDDAIDHPVIASQRDVDRGDSAQRLACDQASLGGADRQDGGMRRVDDGSEARDAEHAQIRDGKGAARVFVRLQSLSAGSFPEILRLRRYAGEPLLLGCEDDRCHETEVRGNGHRDVGVPVPHEAERRIARVHRRNLLQREGTRLDHEIVHGNPGAVRVVVTQAQREKRVDRDVHRQREGGDVARRLGQPRRDEFLNAVQRLERVGSAPDREGLELCGNFLGKLYCHEPASAMRRLAASRPPARVIRSWARFSKRCGSASSLKPIPPWI